MTRDGSEGIIFDIQGHSVHDGPGCRTLVFLGGCPLRCYWCSNPEGLLCARRLMFRARLCASCPTRCLAACPRNAIQPAEREGPLVRIDRTRCAGCSTFECVAVCYRQALQIGGRAWSVNELLRVLRRDQQYWGAEGGVTFSGGEPLVQTAFLTAVLRECREAAMHVAVETSGHVAADDLLAVVPLVNWLFVDLKHIDGDRHREATGVDNRLILNNLRELGARARGWPGRLVVRTTIVPGFNDHPDVARRAAQFLAEAAVREINLLPFHRLGASKYDQLGLTYPAADLTPPSDDTLEALAGIYRSTGLICYVGNRTPF